MMNNRADLNLLAVFDAVASTRSVTRAAERLSLSQPAVSHALNRLRDRLGDPLFVRGSDGLRATPRALEMIEPIKEILRSAETVFAMGSYDPATDPRRFRLAASEYAIATLIRSLIPSLRAMAPKAVLEVLPFGPSALPDLESGALDCCFWAGPLPNSPWMGKPLFSERLVGLISERHPLAEKARQGRISLDDYLAHPHIVVSMKDPFRSQIDTALDEVGRTRTVSISTHSFSANIASLLTSDLITTLPSRLAATSLQAGLLAFEVPLSIPDFTYSLIWHSRTDTDLAMVWFRDLISTLAPDVARRDPEDGTGHRPSDPHGTAAAAGGDRSA